MTLPRLILAGMAVLSFIDGDVGTGIVCVLIVVILAIGRPAEEVRTWR